VTDAFAQYVSGQLRYVRGHAPGRGFASMKESTLTHAIVGMTGGRPVPESGQGMTAELVVRAQRGDRAAFDALATTAYGRLYAIAARILRDPYAAEDAVQDALVRAWRDLRAVRDPERFEAWLHRLLVHACADEGRRAKRRRAEVTGLDIEAVQGDDVRDVADRDELERAFLELSLEHRCVLVLVHYAGIPAVEVAQLLGVPAGTVASRLHYATRQMRTILERSSPLAANPELRR